MHVTTPPIESPLTRTLSIAAIIFSAYSGLGHLTMLLSIWKIQNQDYFFPQKTSELKFSKRLLTLSW
jgi:hypothetical protein